MPPKRIEKKTLEVSSSKDPLDESSVDVTTPELNSPSESPAATMAQESGDLSATDASSAATSFSLSASVAKGQVESPERASAAAEAAATVSPLTDLREPISERFPGAGGNDRASPSLAAANAADSSNESSISSRRSDPVPFEYLSQLTVADLDALRLQLLSLPTSLAQPIVGVGAHGGSLAARADVGAVPAAVATQPSGSSIIPEAPVHPLGNGASGGQLLSQPSSTAFDSQLDSLLASDPRIPCPPVNRAWHCIVCTLVALKALDC